MSKGLRLLPIAVLLAGVAVAHEDDPKVLDRKPAVPGPGIRNAQIARPGLAGTGGNGGLAFGVGGFASSGVSLLSWMPLSDFGSPSSGSDCWGYTSGSGREYALFGHSNGMHVVEVTNPGAPVVVDFVAGPTSLWRDVKVFEDHAYVVSEGGSGVQVVDLSAVDSGIVSLVGTVTTGGTTATHNVAINEASGYLYRCGGSNEGLRIYDLNASKTNPPLVATWSTRYVHDVQVATLTSGPFAGTEIACAFSGYNGGSTSPHFDLLDVSNKSNIVVRSSFQYTNPHYSHQGWMSADSQYVFLGDELDEDGSFPTTTYVLDISDLDAAFEAGSFTNGNSAIGHNMYTVGDLLYQANYTSGLRIFDATNPLAPSEVAWFDTAPGGDAATFNGLWNVYPYFQSGVVIGSDLERGLFVWWIGNPELDLDFVAGAPSQIDPSGESVAVTIAEDAPGDYQAGTAMLHYDDGSGWVSVPMSDLGGGSFLASFGPTSCGAQVDYYLTAQGPSGINWTEPVGAPAALYTATAASGSTTLNTYDMESASGWVSGAAGDTATTGIWTRVDPIGTGAQPEDDHSPGGATCWVTGQGSIGGSVGENDVDGGVTTLLGPVWDLSGAAAPVVGYWRWYSNTAGSAPNSDVFEVDVSSDGGGSWVNVETVGPSGPEVSGGWYRHEFLVTDFVAATSQVRVRFRASDEGSGSIVEAAVDDLEVSDLLCSGGPGTAVCFGDGSGGACPCGNVGGVGEGCANSTGVGAVISASGSASVGADDLVLHVTQARPNKNGVFLQGTTTIQQPFRDGILCVGNPTERLEFVTIDGAGATSSSVSIVTEGMVQAGTTRTYQFWFRDGGGVSPCGQNSNLTNGYEVSWN